MARTKRKVFQFKIELVGIQPSIWRRIQVLSTATFWDLHCAIQDSMGWLDCHLHRFEVADPTLGEYIELGIPDDEWDLDTLEADWDHKIAKYFFEEGDTATYEYDFGDSWHHLIHFEGEIGAAPYQRYPVCLAGERKCPPEDVGGVGGYEDFLEAIFDPNHPEHESTLEWVGYRFAPEEFQPEEVHFSNATKRYHALFTGV